MENSLLKMRLFLFVMRYIDKVGLVFLLALTGPLILIEKNEDESLTAYLPEAVKL